MRKANLLLQTDSYKLTHFHQYPPATGSVYSYLESRGGFFPETVFFGLQYYLQEYLQGVVFCGKDIEDAAKICEQHFGRPNCFNYTGWWQLLKKHEGRLPLEIKAVPEGTVVQTGNVLMTMENTDAEFPWLTNYMETLLLKVWYPITVCTLSREIKKVIKEFHEKTGCKLDGLNFKLHDFGYRGVSSEETAAIGGAAHLVNFFGTDTIAGILLLNDFYGPNDVLPGFSIPASEHSTITAWGKENEYQAFKNLLDTWDTGLVAIVSDSYDLSNAVNDLLGWRLRAQILRRDGTVIVRPDSGNPREVVLEVLKWLESKFGSETNHRGYRVLCPKVRVIQGDGVNYYTIQDTLAAMAKTGWAAENVAFGMGGALLQQLNRDTQRFAIKCSSITVNGESRDVWKSPTGDPSKASKRGKLILEHNGSSFVTMKQVDGLIQTDCLETVFRNGEITKRYTLEEIRNRARL